MIRNEFLDNGRLNRQYSDKNKMLKQNETGIEYSEAIDVMPCKYTYTETDKDIEEEHIV